MILSDARSTSKVPPCVSFFLINIINWPNSKERFFFIDGYWSRLLTYLTWKNLEEIRAGSFISNSNFVIHESEISPSILPSHRSKHWVGAEDVWILWQHLRIQKHMGNKTKSIIHMKPVNKCSFFFLFFFFLNRQLLLVLKWM